MEGSCASSVLLPDSPKPSAIGRVFRFLPLDIVPRSTAMKPTTLDQFLGSRSSVPPFPARVDSPFALVASACGDLLLPTFTTSRIHTHAVVKSDSRQLGTPLMPGALRRNAALHRRLKSTATAASPAAASLLPGWQPPQAPKLSERSPAEWAGIYAELGKSRLSALVVSTTAAGHLMASTPLDPGTPRRSPRRHLSPLCVRQQLQSADGGEERRGNESDGEAAAAFGTDLPNPRRRLGDERRRGGRRHALLGTDCVTASLGALTLGLYTLAYTPMKQRTPLNTWVGAVVGAIPPVMGWTAAGGAIAELRGRHPGTSLFLWQMPHFFALSWMYRDDYKQGGYKMIPLNDPTGERTSWLCLEYSLYLAALPPLCWAAGLTSCMFAIESVAFNGALLAAAYRFHSNSSRGQAHARRLFLVSLGYLPLFSGCLLLHQRRQPVEQRIEQQMTLEDGAPAAPSAAQEQQQLASTIELEAVKQLGYTAVASIDESREAVRAAGRGLCIHEQLVAPTHNASASSGGRPPTPPTGAAALGVARWS